LAVDRSTYRPKPIDTSHVTVSKELRSLVERLSENVHDLWSKKRMAEGWRYAPERDQERKLTPLLVPYDELPDAEKEVDRRIVVGTLKAMLALGYRIEKP
jgi:hypothetical protein